MALNSMGVGFNFQGRDKGLGKTITAVKDGFVGLGAAVVGVASGITSKFTRAVSQSDQGLIAASREMRLSTTNLEAFGVAADKATRKALVGLSMTGEQAGKTRSMLSSAAYGMNLDVGMLANQFKALQQAGVDVRKIGFKDFKEFARFAEVTGLDVETFAARVAYLQNTIRMTPPQIEKLVKETQVIGQHFNLGAEAMNGMARATQVLQEEGAGLYAEWGPQRTAEYLKSATALQGVFLKAGLTAEGAMATSHQLTAVLVRGQTNFHKLYNGLAEDLDQFSQGLTENLVGGPQEAFELLSKAPDQFVAKLQEAFSQVQTEITKRGGGPAELSAATSRFAMQLKEVLGPAATDLITRGIGPMSTEFSVLNKKLNDPKGLNASIHRTAAEFRDGLTPAQHYERILDQFHTRLKRLAGVNNNEFNRSLNESVIALEKNIGALKKARPGFYGFFKTVMETSEHGLGGFLGNLDKSFLAMNALSQRLGPVAGNIIGFGIAIANVGKDKEGFGKRLKEWRSKITDFGRGAAQFGREFVDGIKVFVPAVVEAAGELVQAIYNGIFTTDQAKTPKEALNKLFEHAFSYLREKIPIWWQDIKDLLLNAYKWISGDKSVSSLGEAFSNMWQAARPKIVEGLKFLFTELKDILGELIVQLISPQSLLDAYKSTTKGAEFSSLSSSWGMLSNKYYKSRKDGSSLGAQQGLYNQLQKLAPQLGPSYQKMLNELPAPGAVPLVPGGASMYSSPGASSNTQTQLQSQMAKDTAASAQALQSVDAKHDMQIQLLKSIDSKLGGGGRGRQLVPDGSNNTTRSPGGPP